MADSVKNLTDGQLAYLYNDSLGGIRQKSVYNPDYDVTVDSEGGGDGYFSDPWSKSTENDYDYYKGRTGRVKVPGLESANWGLVAKDYARIDSGLRPKDGGEGYGDIGDMFQRVQEEYKSRNAAKSNDDNDDGGEDNGPDLVEEDRPLSDDLAEAVEFASLYEENLPYGGTRIFGDRNRNVYGYPEKGEWPDPPGPGTKSAETLSKARKFRDKYKLDLADNLSSGDRKSFLNVGSVASAGTSVL